MSLNINVTAPPTGARRMSPAMLEARQRADRFAGVAIGAAKPLTYLAAFQEAEPYLGLPPLAFKLVAWLVKQTSDHDWETGSRPIAWPSAQRQAEYLVLSATRVKALNRALFEAGIFVIRDNEQGKRYGRRGPDKRIIEAYGFDLSPLAQRYDEFIRLAAAAKTERTRCKELRKRITIGRRSIFQAGEMLAETDTPLPQGWPLLMTETAELVATARRAEWSDDLASIAKAIEQRQAQAEQWVKGIPQPVEIDPVGAVCGPHITSTNLNSDLSDTVIASERSSQAAKPVPAVPRPQLGRREPRKVGVAGISRPSELLDLMPQLRPYIRAAEPAYEDIVAAAGGALRQDLGVSTTLWAEACVVMGRDAAALALAIVSTKAEGHFTGSAGGYFAGMVKRARKGELYLEKSLWGLREAKYGRSPSKAAH